MFRFLYGFLSMAALLLGVSQVHGATIAVQDDAPAYATPALSPVFRTIRLSGPVEGGDSDKLQKLLFDLLGSRTAPRNALIVAEVSGGTGDYLEAIKLGDLLRLFRVTTVVRRGEECLSACVLVFLGGTLLGPAPESEVPSRFIEIGGTVGFTNYYSGSSTSATANSKYPVRAILEYTGRTGVERGFTARLMSYPAGSHIEVRTVDDFLVFRTCPIGLDAPATSLAFQALNVCNQSLPWFDPAAHTKVTEMSDAEIRRDQLDLVATNIWWLTGRADPAMTAKRMATGEYRQDEVSMSELVRRLTSGEYKGRDEVASRLYADLKAAGVPLPSLHGANFEIVGYSTGYRRMQCLASLSPTALDRFEVIFEASQGLTAAARSAPEQCRGLLRHARDEVINARPK